MLKPITINLNSTETHWTLTFGRIESRIILTTKPEFKKFVELTERNPDGTKNKLIETFKQNKVELVLNGTYTPSPALRKQFNMDKGDLIVVREYGSSWIELWAKSAFQKDLRSKADNWFHGTQLILNYDFL